MPEEIFVGRKEYLDQFKTLLTAPPGSPYILNLRGQGGMGKTKILQEFVEICEQKQISHAGIIDFYSAELNSRISALEYEIVNRLTQTDVGNFFADYWQLRQGFEQERNLVSEQKLIKQFGLDLSSWSEQVAAKGKRGVLIFDTFEAVKDNLVGVRLLNEWLPGLKSAVVVLSGRQLENEIEFPIEIVDLVINAPVDIFTKKEAMNYLNERQVWQAIEEDGVSEVLFELTGQRPLLLALSTDWILEHVSFGSVSPATLVEGIGQDDFERKLVENLPNVGVLRYPEREILPYMAHIPRPFDAELIHFLFPDIASAEAKTILHNLSQLSFIKERQEDGINYYWFQDELRNLFHKYIFSVYSDTWDKPRQTLSRKMLKFYDQRIKQAQESGNIRSEQRHIANRLYHEIYLDSVIYSDSNEAFTKFQNLLKDARRAYQIGFASVLLGAIRSLQDFLTEQQLYSFQLMETRWLRDVGNNKLAQKRGLELLAKYDDKPGRSVYIYNALGGSTERLGQLVEALRYYEKALTLSQQLGLNDRITMEIINIGRIHKLMGNWELARNYFQQANELDLDLGANWHQIAQSSSQLGHTFGLLGKYSEGIRYCSTAIEIWEDLKNMPHRVGRGKIFRGAVYRMADLYDESLRDIEDSIQIFDKSVENYRLLAESYFEQGLLLWIQANQNPDNQLLLEKAQESLNRSIAFCKEFNNYECLPQALHELSRIYWAQGNKDMARKLNGEAYKLALDVYDVHYTIISLVGMAEFDFDEGKYDKIPEYAQELKQDFEDKGYQFPLFYGRMRRIQGDIAFNEQNYELAVDYYAKGLSLIAQHKGYGIYKISEELDKLGEKFKTLSSQESLKAYKTLKTYWTKEGEAGSNSEIISWVDLHISQLAFRMRPQRSSP